MPKYTVENLKTIENPYKELCANSDTLVENRDSFDQLNYEDKISLATKIILDCPAEERRHFTARTEVLRHPSETEDSFRQVLNRGLIVCHYIRSMADEKNLHPQDNLLGKEFNADLYNEFSSLKCKLVQNDLNSLVTNLALHAKPEEINEMTMNMRSGFRETNLRSALGEALVLKQLLITLTSNEPQKTFTSLDFNPSLFHNYPRLVAKYVGGHEKEIAQKLASSDVATKSRVNRCLDQLRPSPMNENDPLALLYVHCVVEDANAQAINRARSIPVNTTPVAPASTPIVIKPIVYPMQTNLLATSHNRHSLFSALKRHVHHHRHHHDHSNDHHDHSNDSNRHCNPCK